MFEGIAHRARDLALAARATRHRRLLVLAGPRTQTLEAAARAMEAAGCAASALWVAGAHPGVPARARRHEPIQARTLIGSEEPAVVYDLHGGLDPNGLGIVAGLVAGGGLLVLAVPPLARWPGMPSALRLRLAVHPWGEGDVGARFVRRFVRLLRADPEAHLVELGEEDRLGGPVALNLAPLPPRPPYPSAGPATPGAAARARCRTADQRAAVDSILRLGHHPVVLQAHRGRGKSAALGLAAGALLAQGAGRVAVLAPQLRSCSQVFHHARQLLLAVGLEFHGGPGQVRLSSGEMRFVDPHEASEAPIEADVILVDEAAALPVALLLTVARSGARVVFASTVHGYEGTGRGFSLRFQPALRQLDAETAFLSLQEPIRWAADDPVEAFFFRALVLDAALPDGAAAQVPVEQTWVTELDPERLVADEELLRSVFGLLVLAHYRTTPTDLARLLDAPNLKLLGLVSQAGVVGVALIAREGGLSPQTCAAIYEGRERPRGHMLPENLICHLGHEAGGQLVGWRVVRIVVHPAGWGRGLGTHLLRAVVEQARRAGCDYIGSGFGASDELLRYWARSRFYPVRVAVRRSVRSGSWSVVVVRPLREGARRLVLELRAALRSDLPILLTDPLRSMDPDLALALCGRAAVERQQAQPLVLADRDWRALASCSFGGRPAEFMLGPLRALVMHWCLDGAADRPLLAPPLARLLVARVLQARGWRAVTGLLGLDGVANSMRLLRLAMRPLLLHYGGERALAESRRFPNRQERDEQLLAVLATH